MGLKSGSRDSGLDESDEEPDNNRSESKRPEDNPGSRTNDRSETTTEENSPITRTPEPKMDEGVETNTKRPSVDSLPYKLRRNKVNEGREQVPFFLRPEVVTGEDELQSELKNLLGEHVYKSDYREAAMVVAQRRPKLIAEVLREWGYDLDHSP